MTHKPLLLFLFTVFCFTGTEAHAYLFDDYVLMEKNNNQLIYVYEVSAEKLEERGFAQKTADFAKECDTRVIDSNTIESDCVISRNNNVLCVNVINMSNSCMEEFEKPENHKDCRMIYKMFSIYRLMSLFEDRFLPLNDYQGFSYQHCDLTPSYVNSGNYFDFKEWETIITDHKIFIFHGGLSGIMKLYNTGGVDTFPPTLYGYGNFSSNEYGYEFDWSNWHKSIKINITSEIEI